MSKQQFRVFTPQFNQHIEDLVLKSHNAITVDVDPSLEESDDSVARQMVMAELLRVWTNEPRQFPYLTIPKELECPEYVEYEFDQSEIGQPLLPTMIPSSFVPETMRLSKIMLLDGVIQRNRAQLAHENKVEQFHRNED